MMLAFFLLIAALYAAVGHGGASGYLAVMALAGWEPAAMKPTALVFNLIVALIGTVAFVRAGHFSWRLFWPFATVAAPFAYLGGGWSVSATVFRWLVAGALAFAAGRLFLTAPRRMELRPPPVWAVVVAGAGIGFLSGLIGVGGGIFLTPLILFCGWADTKTAAAVSAPFIFVNSAAGLLGHVNSLHHLPASWPWLAAAVIAGGLLGSRWGSGVARPAQLRPALALVLFVASTKLILT
jgi:uncharacterized membrane protein YfcA